jgi:hypothetical protein
MSLIILRMGFSLAISSIFECFWYLISTFRSYARFCGAVYSGESAMEIVDSAESMLLVSFIAGSHCWMAHLIVNAVKSLFDDTESQFCALAN